VSQFNLILPGLIWPNAADYEYLSSRIKLPQFSNLFAKGKLSRLELNVSDFVYAEQLSSGLNLADYYAQKLGLNAHVAYMLLEPTHLRLDRDRLLISEPALLQLNSAEAQQLIAEINEYFVGELEVFYISDELWLIGLNFALDAVISYPLIDIVGENIDEFLPSGNERLRLHKLINEMQMLLFNLPLNKLREDEGLLSINSAWIWDKSPAKLAFEFGTSLANNSSLSALTDDFAAVTSLIVDKAYYPACYRDSFSWLEVVAELDDLLATKLLSLLRSREIQRLNIYVPTLTGCHCLQLSRFDLWKFWRKKAFLWYELAEELAE
jgi:hypothetical protein